MKEQVLANFHRDNELHNREMELKGNIRVFCRTRPVLQTEVDDIKRKMQPDYMPHSAMSKQKGILLKNAASRGEEIEP